MNSGKIVMSNIEEMSGFRFRGFLPDSESDDLLLDFGHQNPIPPSLKRKLDPLTIKIRRCLVRDIGIGLIATVVMVKRFFGNDDRPGDVLGFGDANRRAASYGAALFASADLEEKSKTKSNNESMRRNPCFSSE